MLCSTLLLILVFGAAATDDEASPSPPTSKPSPDAILRSKGLTPAGPVYVLETEEAVGVQHRAVVASFREWQLLLGQMQKLEQDVAQWQDLLSQLDNQRQVLVMQNLTGSTQGPPAGPAGNRPAGPAPPTLGGGTVEQQLRTNQISTIDVQKSQLVCQVFQAQMMFNQRATALACKQAEIERGRTTLDGLIRGIARRYAELRVDPEVKAALAELNKTANPQVVLGPAENYQENVRRMAAELLKGKGVVSTRKGRALVLGVDKDIQMLAYLVESFQADLAHALLRRQALRREAEFRVKRLRDLTRQGADSARGEAVAPERLEKLRGEIDEAERERKEQDLQVAARRAAFVESVDALRQAIAESRRKHEELASDGDAQRASTLLKLRQKKGAIHMAPAPKSSQALLEQAEKLIRTETIALEPDKSIYWINVGLGDGSIRRKMVLDPAAEAVRIPRSLAAEVGLRGDDDASSADGRTALDQSAVLPAVRVGSFSLEEVDCLLLPEGDEDPPVLGAAFLEQFVTKFDPDAATLTLTRVDVKPSAARTGGHSAARTKR